MRLNAPVGYFEVYRDFAKYGYGCMLCHYDGAVLSYLQFSSENRRVVIDKELFDKYKKEALAEATLNEGSN